MKTLTKKSEITAKNLKSEDCDFRGNRIGYDKKEKLYFIGSWFVSCVNYYETIRELKDMYI